MNRKPDQPTKVETPNARGHTKPGNQARGRGQLGNIRRDRRTVRRVKLIQPYLSLKIKSHYFKIIKYLN